MIGRGNTRRGAKRLFAVLQHQKLNQSLVHAIIDEVRSRARLLPLQRRRSQSLTPPSLVAHPSQVIFAVFPELNARAAAG